MRPNPGKFSSSKNLANSTSSTNLIPQINAKTIVACGLFVMLIFMWVKVFVGGSEGGQEISSALLISEAKAEIKVLKLRRLPLVHVPLRHDKLTADMFAPKVTEIENDSSEVSIEVEKRVEIKSQKDAAGKLAKKLGLDAIILGVDKSRHRAFINGKLKVAGDEISIKLNDQIYKVIVVEIFHNKVVLKWNDYTISVRMAQLGKVK